MFYYLYSHFDVHIFQYITFRAGLAFFIAFFMSVLLMPKFIRWASAKKANQPISQFAPESHKVKANTPTMGGIVFIFATLASSLLSVQLHNMFATAGMLTIFLFALIGMRDDLTKIGQNSNRGLSSKMKLALQVFSALIITIFLVMGGLNFDFYIPFYKYPLFDMGLFAIFFWTLVLVAASNAVNITDGLDGLATVPSIFSLASLSLIIYITGNAILSSYLLLPKIPDVGEVAIIGSAMGGALIGFLWFNCHPAQVFMGDSGSLSIGAFIGYMAILSKSEILLLAIGFIFVIETFSVILQIGSYKTRGRRVFLMAPIHHHFEMKGWSENKIIVRFWVIALMSNIIALITLKLR